MCFKLICACDIEISFARKFLHNMSPLKLWNSLTSKLPITYCNTIASAISSLWCARVQFKFYYDILRYDCVHYYRIMMKLMPPVYYIIHWSSYTFMYCHETFDRREMYINLFEWINFIHITDNLAGIVLCMHSADERQHYIVTTSLIGWAHTQKDPWFSMMIQLKCKYSWLFINTSHL